MGVTSSWSPLGNFLEGKVHPDRRIFKDLWICAFFLKTFSYLWTVFLYVDVLLHFQKFNFSLICVVKVLSHVFLCLLSISSVFFTKVIMFILQ